MRKSLIQTIKFLIFLVIGIILLWLAFRNVETRKLIAGLQDADYKWVILSVIFGLFAYLSRTRRWVLLIKPLGYNPSFKNSFFSLMTGYLANLALPRLGEITRCVALGKKEKIPVDQLFGTVVIERTIDLISLLSITVALVLQRGEQINQFLKVSILIPLQQKVFSMFGFTWLVWLVLLIVMILALFLLVKFRHRLRKIRFFAKIIDTVKGFVNGLKTIIHLKNKWEFIFHTVFIWFNYTLMTWIVVYAIDSTSHLTFSDSIFLLVIGGLAMSAPVQSGLGAFHYIISRGLAFVKGVKIEDGLVYAFLTHESQLIFVVIVGTISFFMISGIPQRNRED
ncbi:MAG TPA: lysylphosphatidylglycerol synthase transmembrane domain-containing protein [Bacteroidales bacterium]|nr:flippase-like domain-containing protein [Bacteroidales bacterium]HNR40908.1 lysylphosphatidylglycerol synthase transmembrane domain-containing protein [Bacteroidales bacterium]